MNFQELKGISGDISEAAGPALRIFRILNFAFAVLVMGICVLITVSQYGFMLHSATAQGTIVDVSKRVSEFGKDNRLETFYAPVIKFTADGKEYTFTDSTGTNIVPTVGRTINVIYDKSNPQKAMAKSAFNLWLPWLILLIPFLIFFVFGWFANFVIVLLFKMFWAARNATPKPPRT